MQRRSHIIVLASGMLLAACAPAGHVTKVLTHEALVHQKRDECRELPHTEKMQCLDRANVSYWDSQDEVEELRRQREKEGEKLPDLDAGDRM